MDSLFIIAPIIIVVCLGMALKYKGFLKNEDRETIIKLLYWVVIPALLFRTTYLANGDLTQHKNMFFATYSSLLLVPAVGVLISLIAHKGDRKKHAFSAMASTMSNSVYLGLPTVVLALKEGGMEAVSVYLAVMLPIHNLISLVLGELVASGVSSVKSICKTAIRALLNPLVCSSLLGLAAAALKIPVPETILISLDLIGDTATGLALVALGATLELPSLLPALVRTWPDVLIKLAVHPAIMCTAFIIWPVPEMQFKAAVLIAAMPSAFNTFVMARSIGLDEQYACETVAVSTVLSPISISIWMSLLGIV